MFTGIGGAKQDAAIIDLTPEPTSFFPDRHGKKSPIWKRPFLELLPRMDASWNMISLSGKLFSFSTPRQSERLEEHRESLKACTSGYPFASMSQTLLQTQLADTSEPLSKKKTAFFYARFLNHA